jgi:hypothetical protein
MGTFTRLTIITVAFVAFLGAYFEYFVNRPMNLYVQYAGTALVIVLSAWYLYYLVKQLMKLLNP